MTTSALELALHLPGKPEPESGVVWSDHSETSSFQTDLSVSLAEFGDSATANRDFLRLAVAVFLTDQIHRRPRSWERDLKVTVPMESPGGWRGVRSQLERLLGFLTGDRWTVELASVAIPTSIAKSASSEDLDGNDASSFMLLSGGADSLSGALLLASPDETSFVSRVDVGQPSVRKQLKRLWDQSPTSLAWTVYPRSDPSRGVVGREGTSRSRSLLFFALALLAASPHRRPVLVPENGFASLNVPLVPERSGSHSTRTTHPRYIAELRRILSTVHAHEDLSNPFANLTKGEIFRRVVETWGADDASRALSASISCAKRSGLRVPKPEGTNHCGLCYGCLVRRAAFHSAGLRDRTIYYADPAHPVGHPGSWHTHGQREDIRAFQFAIAAANTAEGIANIRAHLAAARLPDGHSYADAVDLVRRGLHEVKAILP